jgi:mono/diheme cytochrome c family protein
MNLRLLSFLLLFSFALGGCVSLAEDITPPPDYVPPTPVPTLGALFPAAMPDVANGASIFAEKCAPCHGPGGKGDGPQAAMLPVNVPVLAQPEISRRASPAAWYSIVTQGNINNFMPGFASLNDQQRWDVVAYAHSLSITEVDVQAGKAVYEANCAQCHGPNGKSAPNADFTNLQWLASRSLDDWAASVRKGMAPAMPAFEGRLTDAEIYAALAYTRTFAYTAPQAVARAEQATATPAPVSGSESTPETPAPAETDAPAATGGQISGTVTSGAGAVLPAGLKAVLHGFDHGADGNFSETLTLETEVGPDGRYIFENLEMPEGRAFYVSLEYGGVEYSSEAAFVQGGQTVFDLPIEVYETTSDTSLLEISQAHLLLDFSNPEKVTVIHFLVIDNPSGKTIVAPAEGQPVISFSLPQGFENLQFENGILGGRFMATADGFGDQASILPGPDNYQLVFAYDLPYTPSTGLASLFGGSTTDLSIPLTLAARSVTVLVPEGVTVAGSGFTDAGLQSMGGSVTFQMYRAGALPAGQRLEFKISGSPKTTASGEPAASSNQNLIVGVGALGVVLILVGGYLFWRDRRRAEDDEDLPEDEQALDEEELEEEDEDEILDAILALDDQFKAGNIAEAAYRERRAELKAKLSARQ